MGGKDGIKDPRFVIQHAGEAEYSLVTRSSDGQMLFLANMLSKMKHKTKLGSRPSVVNQVTAISNLQAEADARRDDLHLRKENSTHKSILGSEPVHAYVSPP